MDVLSSEAAGFSRHLLNYLEGMEYLRRQGPTARGPAPADRHMLRAAGLLPRARRIQRKLHLFTRSHECKLTIRQGRVCNGLDQRTGVSKTDIDYLYVAKRIRLMKCF